MDVIPFASQSPLPRVMGPCEKVQGIQVYETLTPERDRLTRPEDRRTQQPKGVQGGRGPEERRTTRGTRPRRGLHANITPNSRPTKTRTASSRRRPSLKAPTAFDALPRRVLRHATPRRHQHRQHQPSLGCSNEMWGPRLRGWLCHASAAAAYAPATTTTRAASVKEGCVAAHAVTASWA